MLKPNLLLSNSRVTCHRSQVTHQKRAGWLEAARLCLRQAYANRLRRKADSHQIYSPTAFKLMQRTIEELLTTLNLIPIHREKDTIVVQLANLKLVEIQILGMNSYCVCEITRGNYSQYESEIGIQNLNHYLKLLESSSWRSVSNPVGESSSEDNRILRFAASQIYLITSEERIDSCSWKNC